jgi:hypothetical protein
VVLSLALYHCSVSESRNALSLHFNYGGSSYDAAKTGVIGGEAAEAPVGVAFLKKWLVLNSFCLCILFPRHPSTQMLKG